MAQITVRMPDDLLKEIDRTRGLVPRERWVREALKQALGEGERPKVADADGTGSRGTSLTRSAPAPAPTSHRADTALDRQARLNRAKGL